MYSLEQIALNHLLVPQESGVYFILEKQPNQSLPANLTLLDLYKYNYKVVYVGHGAIRARISQHIYSFRDRIKNETVVTSQRMYDYAKSNNFSLSNLLVSYFIGHGKDEKVRFLEDHHNTFEDYPSANTRP